MNDDATKQMEADIQGLARKLAPHEGQGARPVVVSGGLGSPAASIGAAAVGKRLEALIKRAQELHKAAEVLAMALAGPAPGGGDVNRISPAQRPPDHLFGKQMSALDELSAVLDSVHRAIERGHRSLL